MRDCVLQRVYEPAPITLIHHEPILPSGCQCSPGSLAAQSYLRPALSIHQNWTLRQAIWIGDDVRPALVSHKDTDGLTRGRILRIKQNGVRRMRRFMSARTRA